MAAPTGPPLKIVIYNPALLKKEDLIRGFVSRQPLLDRLLDDLRREASGTAPQHHLIIGQRGLGKTTLLRRLAFAVEDDHSLDSVWQPLVFPEEQYNVANLGDFWLNCADALSDALDRAGDKDASQRLDEHVGRIPSSGSGRNEAALQLLLSEAGRLNRRILLLVDNLDIILDRIQPEEEWEFRRILSHELRLHLLGASSRFLEAFYQHGRAFYDFFQIVELKGFDEEETISTLKRLAEEAGDRHITELIENQPARIKTLRFLTGGNPRTLLLLYRLLSQSQDGDVQGDLESLLDDYTELYKARVKDLPDQAQLVLDAIAIHWDPITAGDLAKQLAPMTVNQVSAVLKRLEDFGVIEKTPWFGASKTGFQIAERFFNIWYLMRASRRVRQRLVWLVKFLESWYDRDELEERARQFLGRDRERMGRERYAEMALAYSQATGDRHLRRSLESAGLRAVIDDGIERLIDFSDLPPEAKDKHERIGQLQRLRRTVCELKRDWAGIDPKEFWRQLGGTPQLLLAEKAKVVEQLASMSTGDLLELFGRLQRFEGRLRAMFRSAADDVSRLYEALSTGEMSSPFDVENAVALAITCGLQKLPFISLRARTSSFLAKPTDDDLRQGEAGFRALTKEEYGFGCQGWTGIGLLYMDHFQRYAEAEEAFRRAIELDPVDGVPRNALGNLLQIRLERYAEAEQAYRQAIQLDPANSVPWSNLGVLLTNALTRFPEAEQAYRHAIELDPTNAIPWHSLGVLLTNPLRRFSEAEQAYRRSIELDPTFANPWVRLGDLLQDHLLRYAEAEQAYRRAIELDPKGADPWNKLGILLADHLQRYPEAEHAYRRSIELDPTAAHPWRNLGVLLVYDLKRPVEAEHAYHHAIELDPTNADPWTNLGDLLYDHLKRYSEAEQAYRRAIELDPTNADPWNNLGILLDGHLKRYLEAEQAFRRAIEIDPANPYAWSNLGVLLAHQEQHKIAAEAHLQAFQHDRTRLMDFERGVAACHVLLGSPMDDVVALATPIAQQAVALNPGSPDAQFLLARVLTLNGKWEAAAEILERESTVAEAGAPEGLFHSIVKTGHVEQTVAILKRTGASERWRPLYEALRAVAAGSPDYLHKVAPEVAVPSRKILKRIAPDLATGSVRKKVRSRRSS